MASTRKFWVMALLTAVGVGTVGCAAEPVGEEDVGTAEGAWCSTYTSSEEYKAELALAWIARSEMNSASWQQIFLNPATQIKPYYKPCPSGSAASGYYLPFNDSRIDSLARIQCKGGEFRLGSFYSREFSMYRESPYMVDGCKKTTVKFRTWTRTGVTQYEADQYFANQKRYLGEALTPFGGFSNRRLFVSMEKTFTSTLGTVRSYFTLDPLVYAAPTYSSYSTASSMYSAVVTTQTTYCRYTLWGCY